MSKKIDFIFWGLVISLCGYCYYFLGVGAFFAVPNAEDFALSIAPKKEGFVSSVIGLLSSYDSRYATNLLHGLNLLTLYQFELFYIQTIGCLVLLILALSFFIHGFLAAGTANYKPLVLSIVFVGGFYTLAPSLSFGLYYMASTFTYIYPTIFWLLWVGCLVHSFSTTRLSFYSYTAFGLMFLLLSFGGSELFIVINSYTLFLLLLFVRQKPTHRFIVSLPYFVLTLAALIFIVACPSGKFALKNIANQHEGRYIASNFVWSSLGAYVKLLADSLFSPMGVVLAGAFIALMLQLRLTIREELTLHNSHKMMSVALIPFLVYTITWVYFFPKGIDEDYPVYVLNVVLFFLLLYIYFAISYWLSKRPLLNRYSPAMAVLLLSACWIGLWSTKNNINLIKQEYADGVLQEVYDKQQAFYGAVEEAHKSGKRPMVVYFENPSTPPKSTYFGPDVQPNRAAADWNLAYEKYFNVDEVRLVGDTVFKQFKR